MCIFVQCWMFALWIKQACSFNQVSLKADYLHLYDYCNHVLTLVHPVFAQIGQLVFKGMKRLNRIQSLVYETAYNTNENLLICAPTGAGKTNIAMLTVLHEIRQHLQPGGVIKKDEFKVCCLHTCHKALKGGHLVLLWYTVWCTLVTYYSSFCSRPTFTDWACSSRCQAKSQSGFQVQFLYNIKVCL